MDDGVSHVFSAISMFRHYARPGQMHDRFDRCRAKILSEFSGVVQASMHDAHSVQAIV
jgi:hypothetical protein